MSLRTFGLHLEAKRNMLATSGWQQSSLTNHHASSSVPMLLADSMWKKSLISLKMLALGSLFLAALAHAFCPVQDLIEEDVMILDTYSEVYVWIGRGANDEEKKESLKIAQEYITSDPSGRDMDSTLLLQVKTMFVFFCVSRL